MTDQFVFEKIVFYRQRADGAPAIIVVKTGIVYDPDCNLFSQVVVFEINNDAYRVKRGSYALQQDAAAREALRYGETLAGQLMKDGSF